MARSRRDDTASRLSARAGAPPAPELGSELGAEGPTCFLAGGLSRYLRPERWASVVRGFPNAKLVPLPEAGHLPEDFLAAVLGFLASARLGLSMRFLADE